MVDRLNPNYTFDRFVVGAGSEFAHAAAHAVAQAPGKAYNPLYLYGRHGMGKTHLLHAIGHSIVERDKNHRILYATTEDFASEYANRNFYERLDLFRTTYREFDSIFIDDIEYLAGHQGAQEEFSHIFNAYHQHNKQIVITSRDLPGELRDISDTLISAFQWGLIAEIEPPDLETIIAVLVRQADIQGVYIRDDVKLYVANKVREVGLTRTHYATYIANILRMMLAHSSNASVPLDLQLARQLLVPSTLNRLLAGTGGKTVQLVSATPYILEMLRKDYSYIHQLPPDKFEVLICDRLSQMGLDVQQVGSTYARDGGVDIIATPSGLTPFPYLLAVQVKHHRSPKRKTGPTPVKEFQSVIASLPFQAGVIVTSTSFTPNAHWVASHRPHIVRLRDMHDLKRWIWDDFANPSEWRELPPEIELAPGIIIRVPQSY